MPRSRLAGSPTQYATCSGASLPGTDIALPNLSLQVQEMPSKYVCTLAHDHDFIVHTIIVVMVCIRFF
jgi:hypothetical protein